MGIKGLSKFLNSVCPNIYEYIHISEYAYKKIAIDISVYIYVLKARHYDPDHPRDVRGWLGDFIKLVECLRSNELHCIFIYDAFNVSHPDKEIERKERREARVKLEKKIYDIEEAVEHFETTGEVKDILIEFQNKKQKRLLTKKTNIDIHSINYYLKRLKKQLFPIEERDFEITKQLFDILEVPYITAPLEAETICSDFCKRGLVDAVLSRDTDVMAYGAPVFLTELNINTGVCKRVQYSTLLEELEYDTNQFLDFCIMCGTDYNKNIFRVGPHKSYNLIKQHKSIENIKSKTKLDTSILNYQRGRELFRDYEKSHEKISYCGSPNFKKLTEFLIKYNFFNNSEDLLNNYIEQLKKSFTHSEIVFEE